MTKTAAYRWGVKLALWKAGLLETNDSESERTNFTFGKYPAEELASVLKREAAEPTAPPTPAATPAIGEPPNPNSSFSGAPTYSYGNDLLARQGLDIRGPENTAI